MVTVMEMSIEARAAVEALSRSSSAPHRKVVQARALLSLADGASVRATARSIGSHPDTVTRWRDRFVADGVAGIGVIAPGRGRKPEIPSATVDAIVHDTLHTVPDDGSARWTTRSVAARHGVGKDTVARIWRARRLRPWQVDTFKLSNDRTSKPSSLMSSGSTSIRRSGRWCSPSMRRRRSKRSTGPSRRCRSSLAGVER